MTRYVARVMVLVTGLAGGVAAHAEGPIIVNSQDNIFGAGQQSAPGGGNVPTGIITLAPGDQCVRIAEVHGSNKTKCASTDGCISLDAERGEGHSYNDPDGVGGQYAYLNNTGTSLISGIVTPGYGGLVGVFLPAGGPSGPAPAALNFLNGKGVGFKKLSPLLDQTFFVGDGLTGDGVGSLQRFSVPAGAAQLVFGISDTCGGEQGPPGCYFDNRGHFKLRYRVSQTACP